MKVGAGRIAFTTDSYIVTPLFFPGGNIGKLAVNGAVNDLAMSGAKPLYLSAAFILEEGLLLEEFEKVAQSIAEVARAAGVLVVTGDAKVVSRGSADKVFITASSIVLVPAGLQLSAWRVKPGDKILVSGYCGDHGMGGSIETRGIVVEGALLPEATPLQLLVQDVLGGRSSLAARSHSRRARHLVM